MLALSCGAHAQVFASVGNPFALAPIGTLDMTMLGSTHSRFGDSDSTASNVQSPDAAPRTAWARGIYTDWKLREWGESKGHAAGFQAGTDLWANRSWRTGVYAGYLAGNPDGGVLGFDNDVRSQYLGYYANWTDGAGLYIGGVLQGGRHRFGQSGDADSVTASIEVGKSFALNDNWSIEPQAQLTYQRTAVGNTGYWTRDSEGGYVGRLGARIKGDFATGAGRLQPYASLNVHHGGSGSEVLVDTGNQWSVRNNSGYTDAEVAVGATLALTPAVSLYGQAGRRWNVDGDQAMIDSTVQGNVGVKLRW